MYNQIILLGVVVSMIFTEITGLSAGLIYPVIWFWRYIAPVVLLLR